MMEVEEHIVEEYLRRRGYLTETNIRLEGNREIDILAYSPSENKRLHIEVSVRLGYPFQYKNRLHGFDVTTYPDRTLKGVGEEEANTLRAEIESEKLRAEKSWLRLRKELKKGKEPKALKKRLKARLKNRIWSSYLKH